MAVGESEMTTAELLALPADGMDRELIRGRLRERVMTRRNRRHSRVEARMAAILQQWLLDQPSPRGEVLCGEAGFRLKTDPDTLVGIDVAYISAELAQRTPDEAAFIDGTPVLAVEILSPSDRHEEVIEKVNAYLSTGVAIVWIVDPDFQTIREHRAGRQPVLFNREHELTAEPELPGFHATVSAVFDG